MIDSYGNFIFFLGKCSIPFLRTIGAIIDMKEGNIRLQFPLRKEMEHFPRKKIKLPYESIMRAIYGLPTKDGNT